jgi:hypothetical protein
LISDISILFPLWIPQTPCPIHWPSIHEPKMN